MKSVWICQKRIERQLSPGQPGTFFEHLEVPLCGNGHPSHTVERTLLFIISICAVMVEQAFDCSHNPEHEHTIFQNFYPWTETFEFRRLKRLGHKFRKDVFWIRLQKLSIETWLFQPILFYARETACEPKKTLLLRWDELGSLGSLGISLKLKNSHNP